MQQINLLHSLPGQTKIPFSAKVFYQLFLGMLGVYFITTLILTFDYFHRKQELKPLEVQRFQAAAAYQEIAQKYPLLAEGGPLKDRIFTLSQALLSKNKAWGKLTHTTLTQGFSPYLTALAQHTPAGVWLTRIHIQQDEDNITLSGQTFRANLVSALMQNLSKTALFGDKPFKLFQIQKVPQADLVQFDISTNALLKKKSDIEEAEKTVPQKLSEKY